MFEFEIVAHFTAQGWHEGDRSAYRRDLGLDPAELLTIVNATQPKSSNKLIALHALGQRVLR